MSNSPCILLNKNINFNKNETESNMGNSTHSFRETDLVCFSSCKNRKLKVKRWWVGARERKKRASFVPFILPEGDFFNICVLSQCIKYLIYFQNLHTFTYQKTLLYTLLVFVFKVVKSLQYIFKIAKFSGYCSALVYL